MLRLAARLSKFLSPGRPDRSRTARGRSRCPIACEALEPRELLTGLGTDYTLMGGQWNNSQTITYSFPPDGVAWDQGTNNINASLDAEYGGTGWQSLVAKALQTWASVTNLNFAEVPDGDYAFNSQGVNQDDPDFGDIRIGGYNFGTTATIARTYGPPPNGQTGAGDVELNTGFNFAPGSYYDLESVFLHELGHSLGLGESPQPSSIMYSDYEGARESLSA
jgi:predicted Zn-dependent protease